MEAKREKSAKVKKDIRGLLRGRQQLIMRYCVLKHLPHRLGSRDLCPPTATQARLSLLARVIWSVFSPPGCRKAGATASPSPPLPGGPSSNSNSSIRTPTSTVSPSKRGHHCRPSALPPSPSTTRWLPGRSVVYGLVMGAGRCFYRWAAVKVCLLTALSSPHNCLYSPFLTPRFLLGVRCNLIDNPACAPQP